MPKLFPDEYFLFILSVIILITCDIDLSVIQVIYEGIKDYFPTFKDVGTRKTTSLENDVTGLYPGTKYTFVVMATTHCGDGDNSTKASGETLMDGTLLLHFPPFAKLLLL